MKYSGSPISRNCAKCRRAWPHKATCAAPTFRHRPPWRMALTRSGRGNCSTVAAPAPASGSTSISVMTRSPLAWRVLTVSGGRLSLLRMRSPGAVRCSTLSSYSAKTASTTSAICLCASSLTTRRRCSRSRICNAAWSTVWRSGKTLRRSPTTRSAPARCGWDTTPRTAATAPGVWYSRRRLSPVASSAFWSATSGKGWTLRRRRNPFASSPKNTTSSTSVSMRPASVLASSSWFARFILPPAISATRLK